MLAREDESREGLMNTDFTVEGYRSLVTAAARRYRFIRIGQALPGGDVALWRHDIDFSPESSLDLARIEAELGLVATDYVQQSSRYYSVFEPEIAENLRAIANLGHDIGLHFDPEVCRHLTLPNCESRIGFEVNILETFAKAKVASITLRNRPAFVGAFLNKETYGGLINGKALKLREQFDYCSESNGVWRYSNLVEIISDLSINRLYALMYPEWWPAKSMPPRQRIQRCSDVRAEFCGLYYGSLLDENSRSNTGEPR